MNKNIFQKISILFLLTGVLIQSCNNPVGGITEEEVIFKNEINGNVIAGTFTKPVEHDGFPVVILISGSAQQDRDESGYGHKPFKVLAEFLSNNGIGVLRYDDLGVGGSTGDVWGATLEVQASDAYAVVKYLKSRPDVDSNKIGVIGHSLGAMQATILASKHKDISFLVLLAGIGIPWSENHIKADRLSNERKGEPVEIIDAGSKLLEPLLDAMRTTPNDQEYSETRDTLFQIIERWRSSLSGMAKSEIDEFTRSNPDFWMNNIAGEYATPIYLSCARFDPVIYLIKIECPVLSIIGENDIQVAPENNSAIRNALIKGGNDNYKIITPKSINHMFQKSETGLISEYEMIEEDFNLNIMMDISDWIHLVTM